MGYMHIDNLYKSTEIMILFKECYALEKIHGTSAHVAWNGKELSFFSGGSKHETFVARFKPTLPHHFQELGHDDVTIYGEAYGGKMQGMKETYGLELRFVVFDVKIGDTWLDVPNAHDVASKLGLEFVHYEKVTTSLEALDAQRDADSVQAVRNGMGAGKKREGVVLRPLMELVKPNGKRIIVKHKRDEFMETATPRKVSPEKLKVLEEAKAIALEWVTDERLRHVLDKLPLDTNVENTKQVIDAMVEDVVRESEGEIVDSTAARKAISRSTALLFKAHLKAKLTAI